MASRGAVAGEIHESNRRIKEASKILVERYDSPRQVADGWPSDGTHSDAVLSAALATIAEAVVALTVEVDALGSTPARRTRAKAA